MRDEERIALGLPVDEREQLASDGLPVKRGVEPLLHLVPREIRDVICRVSSGRRPARRIHVLSCGPLPTPLASVRKVMQIMIRSPSS